MPLSKIDSDSLNSPITAVNLAYTGTLTGGTGVVNLGSGQVYKDASGNVGIGTSSPTVRLNVTGVSVTNAAARSLIVATDTSSFAAGVGGGITFRAKYNTAGDFFDAGNIKGIKENATDGNFAGALVFSTHVNGGSPTERMRIDSSGNLLVGRTTQFSDGQYSADFHGGQKRGATYNNTIGNTGANFVSFGTLGTVIGSISQASGSSVSYATSSDYRLKEAIAPMTGALAKVAALKPVTYKWKSDGSDGQGFIAHELQAVVPDCVHGEKDAVNEDGSIRPQGIDTSFLVATLTAAIQELKAIVDAQGAEIAALKGTP